ncbi:MAG: type III-B CRISPR module-associated protein Cmr5 [Candidatus Accumulibacter meliphilus]|jgi:hypothetical protein|uniref:type III-B CRISPR module-associated protein Cmr5 n=1 Tax=Candidatus Accumulibacter meliphilus TaxID=2211374 RepID=UPI002FC2AA67
MNTLDQRRAQYAWERANRNTRVDGYREMVKGAPALVMGNGLMATLAYYRSRTGSNERAQSGPSRRRARLAGEASDRPADFASAMNAFFNAGGAGRDARHRRNAGHAPLAAPVRRRRGGRTMNVAAVPKYVREAPPAFRNCPPGHRFNLYFEIWQEGNWLIAKNGKADACAQCLALGDAAPVLQALRARQQALAGALPEEQRQIIDAVSTAPSPPDSGSNTRSTTASPSLTPYGLPYLAGSGVKGVLRQAANELRDDGDAAITQPLIDALFGQDCRAPTRCAAR